MLVLLSLLSCIKDETVTPVDTGEPAARCADELLQTVFVDPGQDPELRREIAADFELPLVGGATMSFAAGWQGCDVTVFIPHNLKTFDGTSLWEDGLEDLVSQSAPNARYVFYVDGLYLDTAEPLFLAQQARVDAFLATLSEEDAAHWSERLLVAQGSTKEGWGGWVPRVLGSKVFDNGMVIDRQQQLRGVGGYADVNDLNGSVGWYDSRLERARHEVDYLNWEMARVERMAPFEADAARVRFWEGELLQEYQDITLQLPSSAELEAYDTLEIEVLMECPDQSALEQSNCGAWDYLAHMWVLGPDGETWFEMARFITTYHRESHWVVDASHAMPWLAAGGEFTFRYEWAPSWNVQPQLVTAGLLFTNQGKGMRPVATTELHQGGSFTSTYNDGREDVVVSISSTAQKVEVVSLLTGHGMEAGNCAEFCDHRHEWSVDGDVSVQEFPAVGDGEGCATRSGEGVTPNQGGTWWFGRGGWCPGEKVEPFRVDATAQAADGSVSIGYAGNYEGGSIPDGSGNIELRSWLVVYE